MLNYKIRYIEYCGRIDDLVFDFDKVLSGECAIKEFFGNVCGVEITPETTKIYDNLTDDEEEYNNTCCKVDTKELRRLIDVWCNEVKKFKEKKLKKGV